VVANGALDSTRFPVKFELFMTAQLAQPDYYLVKLFAEANSLRLRALMLCEK